jgi:hypothetical protein
MVDYVAIKSELDVDPEGLGYTGDAQGDTDLMNAVNIVRVKALLSGADVFAATVDTEFDALTDAQRNEWLSICAIESLAPENGKPAASTVIRLFGGGSATVIALAALRNETVSRGTVLGFGGLVIGDIQNARALA